MFYFDSDGNVYSDDLLLMLNLKRWNLVLYFYFSRALFLFRSCFILLSCFILMTSCFIFKAYALFLKHNSMLYFYSITRVLPIILLPVRVASTRVQGTTVQVHTSTKYFVLYHDVCRLRAKRCVVLDYSSNWHEYLYKYPRRTWYCGQFPLYFLIT